MQNDRELLELAAKAIGLDATNHPAHTDDWSWNPLTDDGDALRLAVKLGIEIWRGKWPSGDHYVAAHRLWNVYHSFYEDDGVSLGDDPYAATRRAIVRAAAAIGQSK